MYIYGGLGNNAMKLAIIAIIPTLVCTSAPKSQVFLNGIEDCSRKENIPVYGEVSINSQGPDMHDTQACNVTFVAGYGERLCLTFTSMVIDKCFVKLIVNLGHETKTFDCRSKDVPPTLKSQDAFLEVSLLKGELNKDGYEISLYIKPCPISEDKKPIVLSIISLAVASTSLLCTTLLGIFYRRERNAFLYAAANRDTVL
ncbi:hypothetical protein DPMN_130028 [Dreissena polymorpha]|uniref:Uncharacterized protein n=1 Tax=Dreissena polymorpha TaxID=45954 RepID=A0A9D4K1H5_DREPO|nr:hypothetical protein DPMN_130028 [Dreissena polymorpha]